jgi:hypothetical protein
MVCYGFQNVVKYMVQIDSVGTAPTPDTFKWSDTGGAVWNATGVPILGWSNVLGIQWQNLDNGVQISFDNQNGHVLNDNWVFYAGDGVFLGQRLIYYYKNYGGSDLAMHSFHPGSPQQNVDQSLVSEVPEWNEAMRNTAYSYFRLTYVSGAWNSIPDATVVLKGKKLYDPRSGVTQFSRNPALVWLDFLTNMRYGLGVPQSMVNMQSVISAANWCDSNGYNFDGTLMDRTDFLTNFINIMMNFRAFTIWSEGIYYLKIFTDDAPVMALTSADIEIDPAAFTLNVPGVPETPNVARLTFVDKTQNYTNSYVTLQDLQAISLAGQALGISAEPRELDLALVGTTDISQAQKLAKYALLRNEINMEVTLSAHPRCFALDPGDMVTVTHEFPNWNAKKLRVKNVGYLQDGRIALTLMDENSAMYDPTLGPAFVVGEQEPWTGSG